MLTIGRSGRTVCFAAVSLPGSSNEDRHSVSLSTLKQKVRSVDDVDGDFHAFGIFDGHDGVTFISDFIPYHLFVHGINRMFSVVIFSVWPLKNVPSASFPLSVRSTTH